VRENHGRSKEIINMLSARVLYILVILVVAFMCSIVILTAANEFLAVRQQSEKVEAMAMWWFVSWPVFILLGMTSAYIYPVYKAQTSILGAIKVILVNAIGVIATGLAITYVIFWLFPDVIKQITVWQ
jgi:uncharacterized membrane protein